MGRAKVTVTKFRDKNLSKNKRNVEGEEYERIEYTPYGEVWIEKASTASNIGIPWRFTGKERDEETGLYYYGARYLDSRTGRWLNARMRRKFIPATNSRHGLPVCDNLLDRQFHAEQCGEKRVSDITYVRTTSGRVYLTVVPDLFDRKVIGWALSADMETVHTAIPALDMAAGTRAPRAGLIFHSDRGVQYCAKSFREKLAGHCPSVRQSMSTKYCGF
jgi:RHS repeat-associated protein